MYGGPLLIGMILGGFITANVLNDTVRETTKRMITSASKELQKQLPSPAKDRKHD